MKIEKPWGYENILEQNEIYVLKELFMKVGHGCSLQYHEVKRETIYVLTGRLEIKVNDKKRVYERGDSITIHPKEVHRMKAMSDCLYLEASTPELDDVVRLDDYYGRV